jgi:hypothetical protein
VSDVAPGPFVVIIFYDQISIIGFLSRKINLVLKWRGVTRKSLASHFKENENMIFNAIYMDKN